MPTALELRLPTRKLFWNLKAAEAGHPDAQKDIGHAYRGGLGVKRNEKEAVRWFRKAASHGGPEAQFSLGTCYHEGRGVPRNDRTAIKWFRKAALQKHAWAQFNLGNLLSVGEGSNTTKLKPPSGFAWRPNKVTAAPK
ncbi:MAG: sel1 repeat family protein [Planctomycetota bacterium]|nr:sel1 repeat family protein [Planctomycetota bacterium]